MIRKISLAAIFFLASLNVVAERPTFNYVEIGVADLDHDLVEGDFSGFEIAGSYELEDDFYIAAKYVATDDMGLDMETKTIGLGFHYGLTEDSVLFFQVDAVGVVFSRPGAGEFDEQGNQFTIGYKSNLTDSLEFELAVKRLDAGEVDDDFGDFRLDIGLIGLTYKVTENFAIYADYQSESDSDQQSFGLRYNF